MPWSTGARRWSNGPGPTAQCRCVAASGQAFFRESQRNVSALTNRSAGGNMIHRGSGFAPLCGKAFGFVATEVAQVAELADALDSGSSGRKVVEVRVLSWAPFIPQQLGRCCDSPRSGRFVRCHFWCHLDLL
jgi:hypothetical protein